VHVLDTDFRDYLVTFHETLLADASKYLLPEDRKNIRYLSFMPCTITGYVSTLYGTAIEYTPAEQEGELGDRILGDQPFRFSVDVKSGNARVEEISIQWPNQVERFGPVLDVDGGRQDVIYDHCDFEGRITVTEAVGVDFSHCSLTGPFYMRGLSTISTLYQSVFKHSAWRRAFYYAEFFGNNRADFWTLAKAESRAKTTILSALAFAQAAKRENVTIQKALSLWKDKNVLLLGDFGVEGRQRLTGIAAELRKFGYEPVTLDDVPDHVLINLRQKVTAVGSLARYVIIDDSSKSGHLLETGHVLANDFVTVVLRLEGSEGTMMTRGLEATSKVIRELEYTTASLRTVIGEAVDWAESTLDRVATVNARTWPFYPSLPVPRAGGRLGRRPNKTGDDIPG
jgi:hypothetical protein